MKTNGIFIIGLIGICSIGGCRQQAEKEADTPLDVRTPVAITTITIGPLSQYTELNAVATFRQKNYVKATTSGYLQSAHAFLGEYVTKGKLLFTLKTKEAESIGNTINVLDTTLHFLGVINIRANDHGYITQLNHQAGDYVQDGEQLSVISDMSSFVFLLNVPYELHELLANNKRVELTLPDGEKLQGLVSATMPSVDSVSQTQSVIIKVNPSHPIPENLIAKVKLIKVARDRAVSLPKTAILTNETQDAFWVMKLIDDSMAVKIPVKKGMEVNDRVEILDPVFTTGDKIVISGNYGLPDTAKVKVIQ